MVLKRLRSLLVFWTFLRMRTFLRQYMRSVSSLRWPKLRNILRKSERYFFDMVTMSSGKVSLLAHEILVLIALSTNEGSSEPVQMYRRYCAVK